MTPGLVIGGGGSLGIPSIRGVGALGEGVTLDPNTAVYVDGVYSPRFGATLAEFADVKRIEVLKGPQVVLYGRNATAGAINIISNDPGSDFGGSIKTQFGNLNAVRVDANVDVPLIRDELLFRASLTVSKDDGYINNLLNSTDHPGKQDGRIGRFTLKYMPANNLDVTLRGYFSDDNGAVGAADKVASPAAFGSAFPINDPYTVTSNQISSMPRSNSGANLTVNWDLDWAKLTSISAYIASSFGPLNYDGDTIETTIFNVGVVGKPSLGLTENSQALSQEIYLGGDLGRLNWLTGGSFLHENGRYGGADEVAPGVATFFPATDSTNAYAAYGQLAYAITDSLHITGGARYSYESKTAGRTISDPMPAPLTFDSANWGSFTYSANVKYNFDQNKMVYATMSTGFKSGGFDQFSLSPALSPEKITNYEVGAKASWLDDRLSSTVALFDYRYTDLQIETFIPPGTFVTENAGRSKGRGLEAQILANPIDGLQLSAGTSVLSAKYTKYVSGIGGVPVSYAGNRLPNAPVFTFNVGASYTVPVSDVGSLSARIDYYHSSRRYFESSNDPNLSQGAYGLLNARLGFDLAKGNWGIAAYARNLTDQLVYSAGYSAGPSVVRYVDPPRTFGIELDHNF